MVNEFKRWKTRTDGVFLSGLPGLQAFNAVDEPATLAQRWLTCKDEFELYVTEEGASTSPRRAPSQRRV